MLTETSSTTSLHQLISEDGAPLKAEANNFVWVEYDGQQFGSHTYGNNVTPYTTGKAYFAALIEAIENANEEIFIASWQVSWDALLAPGVRLFDVLLKAAKNKKATLKIYVMPWNDSAPIQTFDDQTKSVLLLINEIVGSNIVSVYLAKSLADKSPAFFSHHQKHVVIDRKIGFIGGLDLCYGRYDDASYDLHADADGRVALNRYNGCISQVGKVDEKTVVDPDLLTGAYDRYVAILDKSNRELTKEKILGGAWQTQYADDSPDKEKEQRALDPVYLTIDPEIQPRMPWQDVHCRIDGPAVSDLAHNFVGRWNAQSDGPKLKKVLPPELYKGTGTCQVQVLRSASINLRKAEEKAAGLKSVRLEKQDDLLRAMIKLINNADHFIYIENQFFVSAFGVPTHDLEDKLSQAAQAANQKAWNALNQTTGAAISRTMLAGESATAEDLPKNGISSALAFRIDIAIRSKSARPFHVILTLPVHPEGPLNNGPIITQIYWTMQTLVFASQSLLNQIRRSIKAQQLREKNEKDADRAYADNNKEYEEIEVEECFKYITLLNLRNWEKLGNRYVTEQIYIHSKLLIVDDRYVIMGSGNINDRSLLGDRDTEIAVLIVDEKVESKDICNNGKPVPVRSFAHELRKSIWSKIFGFTSGTRTATELKDAIEHPAYPESWKAIQRVAKKNSELYDAAFDFIPRNKDPNDKEKLLPASLWPVWDTSKHGKSNIKRGLMPFEPEFWTSPQHNKSEASSLTDIRGYITELPIEWTMGENNNLRYHTALVADNSKVKIPQDLEKVDDKNSIASLRSDKSILPDESTQKT